MKSISVFLGSSIVEMQMDRIAFADIISELNSKLKARDYFIYLDKCEYEDGLYSDQPTQKSIDMKVLKSSYSFFLVKTKFGKMTEHEFSIALDSYSKFGSPRIGVMFRRCEDQETLSKDALLFKMKLEEMQYYYREYSSVEELKLVVVLNLAIDDPGLADKIEAEDGGIYVDGSLLVDMEDIPVHSKHSELNKLRKQLDELENKEREGETARERRFTRERINEVVGRISEIERLILRTMLGLTQATRGEITPLLRRAIIYLENGDVERAAEILNIKDVTAELDSYKEKAEISLDGIDAAISTAYIAIESMTQLPPDAKRSAEIELLYEKIIVLETEYNLKMDHCGLYAKHLLKKKKTEKAVKYALLFIENVGRREKSYHDFVASEYSLGGLQWEIEPLYQNNKEEYQSLYLMVSFKYIKIYQRALSRYEHNNFFNHYQLGIMCDMARDTINNWIGQKDADICKIQKELDRTVEMLERKGYRKVDSSELDGERDTKIFIDRAELFEKMEKLNDEPDTDDPLTYMKQYHAILSHVIDFINSSNNIFLQDNSSIPQILKEYEHIQSSLSAENDEQIRFMYVQAKLGHADHYFRLANFEAAKKGYEAALDIMDALSKEGDALYKMVNSTICLNLSNALAQLSSFEYAEQCILKGIRVREELIDSNAVPEVHVAKLYLNYMSLCMSGRLYNCIQKALEYSQKAYDIYTKENENLDQESRVDFIKVCINYGLVHLENGKTDEAFKYFDKGLDNALALSRHMCEKNNDLLLYLISHLINISIKSNAVEQTQKKLEGLFSKETIRHLFSSAINDPNDPNDIE